VKTWDVQIRATVTKTMRVQAEDAKAATELAHALFDTACTDEPESYKEETLNCEEVK
jgi:hypothetical protein